jgi:hypothetical protein
MICRELTNLEVLGEVAVEERSHKQDMRFAMTVSITFLK